MRDRPAHEVSSPGTAPLSMTRCATSQDHNIKLREVAQRVIESGAVPGDETS